MNLGVSSLFFVLAFIFIPGIVWMRIHRRYLRGKRSTFDMIVEVFIFGVLSYAILYCVYLPFGRTLSIFEVDTEATQLIDPGMLPDVLAATLVAIAAGIVSLYFETYKLLTRFVHYINATTTYGDEDVWNFVFNSQSESVDFVHFRDFDQRVVYAGYVDIYSDNDVLRELVLRDVEVYDFEGLKMYDVPRLYIAKEPAKIHIEFPGEDQGDM